MSAATPEVVAQRESLFRLFDLETSGGRIPAMEGLRAYAVLLTFCVHYFGGFLLQFRKVDTQSVTPADLPAATDRFLAWLQLSPYGVYLFFILSGFLICRLVGNSRSFAYPRFLWRRLCRIYPAFLIALGLGVWVFAFYAGWAPFSWRGLAANALLLNGVRELGVIPYLHQTWSLFNEIVFYLVFPAFLLLRPAGVWNSPWAMAAAGAVVVYLPFALGWGQAVYLLFFAGATAARFSDDALASFARRVPESLIVALYLAVTTSIAFKVFGDHVSIWLYAIAATLFTISACYGTGWLNRVFTWRPVRRVGNISYSLFLTHTIPVFFVVYVLGPRAFGDAGLITALAGAALAFTGALALAAILFLVAERPYFVAQQRRHS